MDTQEYRTQDLRGEGSSLINNLTAPAFEQGSHAASIPNRKYSHQSPSPSSPYPDDDRKTRYSKPTADEMGARLDAHSATTHGTSTALYNSKPQGAHLRPSAAAASSTRNLARQGRNAGPHAMSAQASKQTMQYAAGTPEGGLASSHILPFHTLDAPVNEATNNPLPSDVYQFRRFVQEQKSH